MTNAQSSPTTIAERLFLEALRELGEPDRDRPFFLERDVVYTMQLSLRTRIPADWTVFNDFGMLPGPQRALCADLALLDEHRAV